MATKKPRRIWSIIAGMLNTVSYILLIVGLSLIISTFAILVANDVLALIKDGGEVTVELSDDSTPQEVGLLLQQQEIIEYPWAFELFSMLKKVEVFEAGTFTLDTSMDYNQMISALRDDSTPVSVVRVTIPEGYSLKDICALLVEKDVVQENGLAFEVQRQNAMRRTLGIADDRSVLHGIDLVKFELADGRPRLPVRVIEVFLLLVGEIDPDAIPCARGLRPVLTDRLVVQRKDHVVCPPLP